MNTRMLENYDVHHYSVFWKKEVPYLVLEWDMNDHCTLTQRTMVNKSVILFLKTKKTIVFILSLIF